ncbi:MGMT family protein [Bacillus sp. B1-b2]|uniref:MGMT family protein n=1 Tax=Bacillus sp. B1-b2 TaxID=2653201 RepID=UPI0012619B4F|nr:MGMT family protein [Bacillus sp. B1-b2]KAB7670800.1 MGMT family protein [Bacillus sp. B1-b2]
MTPFTTKVIAIIKEIPTGRVMTYGQIAKLAGSPRAARQVVRVLHSMSKNHQLPWHRVINSRGYISINGDQATIQRQLLENEGISSQLDGSIDLKTYGYEPLQWMEDEYI